MTDQKTQDASGASRLSVKLGVVYEWWQCQSCGEPIGLLGRMLTWMPLFGHKCKHTPND